MEILLIRHGETDWNRARRMQGHIDIPLNNEGLRQAKALGAALASEKLDAIYTSDLQRAKLTAQAVADIYQMPLIIDEQLRERCYGVFEGLKYREVAEQFPDEFALWQARDLHARFPAGEREELLRTVAALPADVSVLLIEHDMDLVFSFAKSMTVMVNGAVLTEGTPAEMAGDARVREVYLGHGGKHG